MEPVEKPSTEDDEDAGTAPTVVQLSNQLDTKAEGSVKKTHLITRNGISAGNHEEPLLLVPPASNTLDTLFGSVSDSDSGEPAVDGSAANETAVVLAGSKDHPSAADKVLSSDMEEGEIVDSDTEQSVVVLPSNVASVADKENAVVNVKSRLQADTQRSDRNQQNTNCAKQSNQSAREKASKSTSHTPPQKQISCEKERSPSSVKKNRSGSDTHPGDRRRSPPRKHPADDRRNRPAIRESAGHSGERRIGSGSFRTERRQLSPRKNAEWSRSRTASAKFPFRGCRNSAARSVRPPRRC